MTNARRFSAIIRNELSALPSQIARTVADEISQSIQLNFDRGRDPYGKPWLKLARSTLERGRRNPPLTASGAGRASVKVYPKSGAGVSIVVGKKYMLYHQFGGKSHLPGHKKNKDFGRDRDRSSGRAHPPQRSFLPFDEMPLDWILIYQRACDEQTAKLGRVLRG